MCGSHYPVTFGFGGSPEGLSSRSLRYLGAEVDHLDFEDLRDVWLLSDRHRGPEQLEGDDHCNILNTHTHTQLNLAGWFKSWFYFNRETEPFSHSLPHLNT